MIVKPLKTPSPSRKTRRCYGESDIEHSLRLSLTCNIAMIQNIKMSVLTLLSRLACKNRFEDGALPVLRMRMMMRCSGYQLADALAMILALLLAEARKYDRRYIHTIIGGSRDDIYMALNDIYSGLIRDSKIGNTGLEFRMRNGSRRLEMEAKGRKEAKSVSQAPNTGNGIGDGMGYNAHDSNGITASLSDEPCPSVPSSSDRRSRGRMMRGPITTAVLIASYATAAAVAGSLFFAAPKKAKAATGDLAQTYNWGTAYDYGISVDPSTKYIHSIDTVGRMYESSSLGSTPYYFMTVPVSGEYNFADMAENSTYFWVTGNSKDKIWRINKSTKEIVDEWSSPSVNVMGLEWYDNKVWATKPNAASYTNLYKYNDETHNLESTIKLTGVTMSTGLGINQSTGTFYVCKNDNSGFWSFNIQSDAKDIQFHSFSEAWDSARGAACLDSDYLLVLYAKSLQGSKIYKYEGLNPVPTPTPSPTASPSTTPTKTPTITPTPSTSPTISPTASPTPSPEGYKTPTVTPTATPSIIIDNLQAELSGSWTLSNGKPHYWATNYAYCWTGDPEDKARFRPSIPAAGRYNVYYWLPDGDSGRSPNAPFTVVGSGEERTYLVDERGTGGAWILLGTHRFNQGTGGYVEVSDRGGGTFVEGTFVVADALRFVWSDAGSPTPSRAPTPSPSPTCGPSVPPNRLAIAAGDYDGNGRADIGVFRPSQGLWSMKDVTRAYFGGSDDHPASGDYNGDGTAEMAVFRPVQGLWSVKDLTRVYLGGAGDLSSPGDYDGDGSCDIAIFRENGGMWSIRNLSRFYFGGTGDWPLSGDWDGNGMDEAGLYRPSSGQWMARDVSRFYLGASSDWPIPGDYKGEGGWQAGIFRPCSGMWAIRDVTRIFFGNCFDHPVPADYDGAGTCDIGIFRDSAGLWSIRNVSRTYFGTADDIPVAR